MSGRWILGRPITTPASNVQDFHWAIAFQDWQSERALAVFGYLWSGERSLVHAFIPSTGFGNNAKSSIGTSKIDPCTSLRLPQMMNNRSRDYIFGLVPSKGRK